MRPLDNASMMQIQRRDFEQYVLIVRRRLEADRATERRTAARATVASLTLTRVEQPQPDVHVYLDTNVIVDLTDALNERWEPPGDLGHPSNLQRIYAARLFFYGYRGRIPPGRDVPWFLVTSTTARRELERKVDRPDLISTTLMEVDMTGDAPPDEQVIATANRLADLAGITDLDDATHLAQAALRHWIRYFVTSDKTLRKRSLHLDLFELDVISVSAAVDMLAIAPGEAPPIGPYPPWMVPD